MGFHCLIGHVDEMNNEKNEEHSTMYVERMHSNRNKCLDKQYGHMKVKDMSKKRKNERKKEREKEKTNLTS